MAHEFLDRGEIDAFHDELAGKSVTEGMEGGQVLDFGILGDFD